MAASAADIRSVLPVPSASHPGPSTPAPTKKSQSHSTRKPDGISRELYSLIGPSAPSLAAQLAKPKLKQKPNLGSRSVVKWEWRSFKNPARSDGLQLGHWVKSSTDPNEEYPFAKYNVQSTQYKYTDDEYANFLQDAPKDGSWSKDETDYLFQVAREYDLRWHVIYDRYEFPNGVSRSMEDLKDRYYSVCRKLIRNRPWEGDEVGKNQLLASYHFDKEREITRKKYVASLEDRTPDQLAEEEALYIELKRLEQNERKFKKEREDLMRMLAGTESGLPDVIEDENPFNSLHPLDIPKKKKKTGVATGSAEVDSPTIPNVISLGPPIVRKPRDPRSIAYDAQHCIIRTELPPNVQATKAAHLPAHMRSFKLPYPKAALAPKINQVFAELGVNNSRLVMPTKENCTRFENLLEAVTTLVESKKVLDKLEYDIQVAKKQLGMRTSEERSEPAPRGKGKLLGKIPAPMDIDEGDDEADGEAEEHNHDGRAQSVVSTKSGRSRRPSRRSMSISSVDTNATASARIGIKRKNRS